MSEDLAAAERNEKINLAAESIRERMILWASVDIFNSQSPHERWLTSLFAVNHGWET